MPHSMLVGAETLPPGKQKPACISDAQYILIKGKRCDRFNLFNLHSSPFFAFFFSGWTKHYSDLGCPYYVNDVTKVSAHTFSQHSPQQKDVFNSRQSRLIVVTT